MFSKLSPRLFFISKNSSIKNELIDLFTSFIYSKAHLFFKFALFFTQQKVGVFFLASFAFIGIDDKLMSERKERVKWSMLYKRSKKHEVFTAFWSIVFVLIGNILVEFYDKFNEFLRFYY